MVATEVIPERRPYSYYAYSDLGLAARSDAEAREARLMHRVAVRFCGCPIGVDGPCTALQRSAVMAAGKGTHFLPEDKTADAEVVIITDPHKVDRWCRSLPCGILFMVGDRMALLFKGRGLPPFTRFEVNFP